MSRARYKQTGSDVIDTAYFYGLNIIKDPDRSPRLRNAVLRRTIPIYPNYLYDAAQVTKTYNELMSLGFFRSAKITFSELRDTTDTYVSYIDNSRGDGGETVDTREGFLRCDIYATPALKQSVKVELEASTTSSFYGLSATLGYSNRNIFQGAESFDASVRVAYEYMKAPRRAQAQRSGGGRHDGLSFPRFLLPFHVAPNENILQPRTRLELSFDYQNRPYYRRNLSSIRWAYSWSKGAGLVVRAASDRHQLDRRAQRRPEVPRRDTERISAQHLRPAAQRRPLVLVCLTTTSGRTSAAMRR